MPYSRCNARLSLLCTAMLGTFNNKLSIYGVRLRKREVTYVSKEDEYMP
jgi:hypothetical protein